MTLFMLLLLVNCLSSKKYFSNQNKQQLNGKLFELYGRQNCLFELQQLFLCYYVIVKHLHTFLKMRYKSWMFCFILHSFKLIRIYFSINCNLFQDYFKVNYIFLTIPKTQHCFLLSSSFCLSAALFYKIKMHIYCYI